VDVFDGGDGYTYIGLTAIPEPASVVMLGTGALALLGQGLLRRCRRA